MRSWLDLGILGRLCFFLNDGRIGFVLFEHQISKRFRLMETEISKDNLEIDNLTLGELEEFWVKIKSHE